MAKQIKQADDQRLITEHELHYWQNLEQSLDQIDDEEHAELLKNLKRDCMQRREHASDVLEQFVAQRESLREEMSLALNPFWGSLFRAGSELTYYGRQLEDFACVYTSRASNIALYPENYYFRSSMDYLPHEIRSM